MKVTIKSLKERTKKADNSKYIIMDVQENDSSYFCWTPELLDGKKPGDVIEVVTEEKKSNGKLAYYIHEVKDVAPEPVPAAEEDDAPIPADDDAPEYSADDEAPIPPEEDEVPAPTDADAPPARKPANKTAAMPNTAAAPAAAKTSGMPNTAAKTAAPKTAAMPNTATGTATAFKADDEEVTGENMEIYNSVRKVPTAAKKPINAGRLKGMTDINPVWRIKKLTEKFGPVGFGWKYVITKKELVEVANNAGKKEIKAFVDIDLFYKYKGEWSEAIPGTGGSSFVSQESAGMYVSDECYKMALTDAISVACKAIGIGADVYWEADASDKYNK